MTASGMDLKGIHMYSYLVSGVFRKKFFRSMTQNFAPGVDKTELRCILTVVMTAVGLLTGPS